MYTSNNEVIARFPDRPNPSPSPSPALALAPGAVEHVQEVGSKFWHQAPWEEEVKEVRERGVLLWYSLGHPVHGGPPGQLDLGAGQHLVRGRGGHNKYNCGWQHNSDSHNEYSMLIIHKDGLVKNPQFCAVFLDQTQYLKNFRYICSKLVLENIQTVSIYIPWQFDT